VKGFNNKNCAILGPACTLLQVCSPTSTMRYMARSEFCSLATFPLWHGINTLTYLLTLPIIRLFEYSIRYATEYSSSKTKKLDSPSPSRLAGTEIW